MSTNAPAIVGQKKTSILASMAAHYGMDPDKFHGTMMATIMPKGTTPEQVAAFLIVAHKYELNPFTKEIYAFKGQNDSVVPIVGIDGWMTLANRQPMFDGIEYIDNRDANGKIESITAIVYRKDRAHPIKVTEYLSECKRNTPPWNTSPNRMLRHRATAQGIRYAFGIGGVLLPDEAPEIGEFEVEPRPANGEVLGAHTASVEAEVVNTTTGEITEKPPTTGGITEAGPGAEATPGPVVETSKKSGARPF